MILVEGAAKRVGLDVIYMPPNEGCFENCGYEGILEWMGGVFVECWFLVRKGSVKFLKGGGM